MKQRALAAAKEKRYSALLDAQAEATLDLYEAQKKLQDGEADLVSVQQQLQDEFGYTADELNELFRQYDESGTKSGNDLIDKFVELRQQLPVLKANIDDATDAVEEQDTAIAELAKTLGDTTDATGQLSTAQGEAATATTELTEEQKALAEEFQNVKESAMDSLDSTTGMFEKMDSTATTSIASMTESLNSNAATLSAYSENLRKALEMGYAPELVQQWAAGDAESMAMVAAAVQGTTTDVNTLNAAFNNYTASRGNTASVQASIVTGFNAIGDAAASASTKIESGLVTPTVDSAGTMQQAMTNAFTASGEAVTDEWTNKGQWFADNVEKPMYMVSDSGSIVPSGSWGSTIPTVPQGKYLWTRVIQTYNTGSPITSYSVSRFGLDGTGSVSSVNSQNPDSTGNVNLTAADIAVSDGQSVEAVLDEAAALLYNNAGAHNAIYRGKNLGTSVTAAQWAAIANGTFADLYIGDYWVIGGVNWRIAAFDYYYKTGDTSCTTHHVVIVPDTSLYSHVMNDTNITTGGYIGSKMYTEGLAQAKTQINSAFGSSHILSHRQLLVNAVTNGKPSGGSWYDSTVELMTEQNVYGGKIFGAGNDGSTIPYLYTIDKSQFPLFAHDPSMISNRQWFWLRDVVSAALFSYVNYRGFADYSNASDGLGVRPAFSIKS